MLMHFSDLKGESLIFGIEGLDVLFCRFPLERPNNMLFVNFIY